MAIREYQWRITFCVLLTLFIQNCYSQPLRIGDKLPDLKLQSVINYSSSEIHINDFNSKLIILDFWGTGCTSCIEAFPKIDSLQTKFNGKLQIIAVNNESRDSTIRFFNKHKKINLPAIPFVTGDTILSALFPHNFVPHHVWIDSTKTVQFITFGWNANFTNISNYLAGKQLSLYENKFAKESIVCSPIIEFVSEKTEYYSLLTHFVPEMRFSNSAQNTAGGYDHPNRISRGSSTILNLFITAFSEGEKYNFQAPNSVILNVAEKSKYFCPSDDSLQDQWIENNSYNYDLLIPSSRYKRLYKYMQQDLMRYFDVDAKIIKRKTKCWVLTGTTANDKIATLGEKSRKLHHGMSTDTLAYIHNRPFPEFVSWLRDVMTFFKIPIPLIDGTNYHGYVDIGIPDRIFNPLDFKKLKSELRKYDLDIIEKIETIDVLYIQDNQLLKKRE